MTREARRIDADTVDWADVRRRVDEARQATRETLRLSSDRARAVLEERARELARTPPRGGEDATREVLLFSAAGQRYAIDSRFVVEVVRLADLALLPGAEPPVIGVVGWRGRLLTIMDLRLMLGGEAGALDAYSRIVVLGEERAEFGVLADAVEEITTLQAGDIRAPGRGVRVNERYVRGIAPDTVLVLEATELLRIDDDATTGDRRS